MNFNFLQTENWLKLGSGSHSESTRDIHNWCSQLSLAFSNILEHVKKLEKDKIFNE